MLIISPLVAVGSAQRLTRNIRGTDEGDFLNIKQKIQTKTGGYSTGCHFKLKTANGLYKYILSFIIVKIDSCTLNITMTFVN